MGGQGQVTQRARQFILLAGAQKGRSKSEGGLPGAPIFVYGKRKRGIVACGAGTAGSAAAVGRMHFGSSCSSGIAGKWPNSCRAFMRIKAAGAARAAERRWLCSRFRQRRSDRLFTVLSGGSRRAGQAHCTSSAHAAAHAAPLRRALTRRAAPWARPSHYHRCAPFHRPARRFRGAPQGRTPSRSPGPECRWPGAAAAPPAAASAGKGQGRGEAGARI